MKKIFLLILLFVFPTIVQAVNRYDIDYFLIDSEILENGAMKVRELLVLNGNLDTFQKNIYYRNSRLPVLDVYDYTHSSFHSGTGLSDIEVSVLPLQKDEDISFDLLEQEFMKLPRIYYEEDKTNAEYVESSTQDGKTLKIFYQVAEGKVAILIEYCVKDVILKHKDVAELYWTFVDSEFQSDIDFLKIRVTLPESPTTELHSTWIHGDLTGSSKKINEKTVESSMRKVAKETAINIRMTFDASIVKDVNKNKKTNIQAYSNIINAEKKRVSEEQKSNNQREKVILILSNLCKFYIVVILIWWIYVYFRYDREYKSSFQEKYFKEIITDYDITVASTFLFDGVVPIAFVISFLNLILRKNIKISIWPSRKGNYEFILDHRENVSHTEDVLLDLLFEKVGNKNRFSLGKLKKYVSEAQTAKVFERYYLNWQHCVEKDTMREEFYEKNGQPIITSIFLLLLSFFLLFANLYFEVSLVLPWIVFLLSAVFFFYSSFLRKKSRKGIEDYTKWKAYETYLEECDELCYSDSHLLYSLMFSKEEKFLKHISRNSIFKNEKLISSVKAALLEAIEKVQK